MSKPINARCKYCKKFKTQPNVECPGSEIVHPLPTPPMGKLPEQT